MPITTTPSGGPQGEFSTYTPIYTQTLSTNTSSITFSNIPTTFSDLKLVINGTATTTGYAFTLRVNSDASSNYSQTLMSGNGTNAQSARYSNSNDTNMYIGGWVNGYDSATPSTIAVDFMNYSNININKTILWRSSAGTRNAEAGVMSWRNTAPITTITISSQSGASMATGSTFTLYGIKAAAAQFIPTKAAGGDIVVSDGTYAYHAFLTSGTFSTAQSLTCDFMMVGGGGGGGHAGGGAGGFRLLTSQSFAAAQYPVVVGAGGIGSNYQSTIVPSSANGTSTTFKGTSATYGGGGGNGDNSTVAAGRPGGSGGGEGFGRGNASAGTGNLGGFTPVEGYAGGLGLSDLSTYTSGGGGGGAGGIGQTCTTSKGGDGGIGAGGSGYTNYTIINAMAAATGTGVLSSGNYYYAGGGGGNSITQGSGGLGGGGQGATGSYGSPVLYRGQQSTGGGGGGANSDSVGATGGSGLVIVRYLL
jgi:hypothetical protein